MTRSFLLCITLSVLTAACSTESSSTAPTPPPPAPTRILRVGGDLSFGDLRFFETRDGALTVSNDGTENLEIIGISYQRTGPNVLVPGNILTAWCREVLRPVSSTTFAVAPGQTLNVPFRFAPVLDPVRQIFPRDPSSRFDCSGTVTVSGNHTSGTSTIAMTAIAVP